METFIRVLPALLLVPCLIFWIFMLRHVMRNNLPNKQLWLVIVIFGSVIGAVFYYFEIYSKTD